MAYEPQTWNDNDPATPLSAARLAHMEQGIDQAHELAADAGKNYATRIYARATFR